MNDYLKELEYRGLTSRIKRLSDKTMAEGRQLYDDLNMEIEPNWFLIMEILRDEGVSSVSEISKRIKFSHPSVIAIVKKMVAKDYLKISPSKKDKRKQELRLSKKAIKNLPEAEKVWTACEKGMRSMFLNSNFIKEFDKLEKAFQTKGFYDRVLSEYKRGGIEYTRFKNKYANDFFDLNKVWIDRYFVMEKIDSEVLSKPKKYIIDKGGQIEFALAGSEVIGTYALINMDGKTAELSKMVVREDFHGYGIGSKLLERSINLARECKYKKLILFSNTILEPAIHLYRKYGFKEVKLGNSSEYKRSNIKMSLKLNR